MLSDVAHSLVVILLKIQSALVDPLQNLLEGVHLALQGTNSSLLTSLRSGLDTAVGYYLLLLR
jgi:hypothetical protein